METWQQLDGTPLGWCLVNVAVGAERDGVPDDGTDTQRKGEPDQEDECD
jgi:hypothetical protein